MNRFLRTLFGFLSIAFLGGAYLIQLFTMRKLGMNRWVVYQQMRFKNMLPLDGLKLFGPLLGLILVVLVCRAFRKAGKKRKTRTIMDYMMMGAMVLVEVLYLAVTLFMDAGQIRAYYLVLPMIGLSLLMLIFLNLTGLARPRA